MAEAPAAPPAGDPPKDPATPAPAAGDPPAAPAADPPAPESKPAGSPEAVLADLAGERRARQAAERELATLKREKMTADERAVADAKDAGAAEVRAALLPELVKSNVRAIAAGKVTDPEDVIALLGDLTRFAAKDNTIDTKTIATEIEALVKAKPYLTAGDPPGRTRALPGGSGKPATGTSINDDIRQMAGRRG
jgi:hypothetical protein